MSKTIAIIGMPEQGKSRFVKEYLKGHPKRNALAYDVNGYEYGEKWGVNLSTDTRQARCRYFGEGLPNNERYKNFLELIKGRKNCDVIFEEATGYLAGRMSNEVIGMLIDRRHTGNNYFALFHSIKSVPPTLLVHLDYIYLLKTMDDEEDVRNKDKRLLKPWQEMRLKPYGSKGIMINWSGKQIAAAKGKKATLPG